MSVNFEVPGTLKSALSQELIDELGYFLHAASDIIIFG